MPLCMQLCTFTHLLPHPFNSIAKQTYYQTIAEYTCTLPVEREQFLNDWARQANPNNNNLETIVM